MVAIQVATDLHQISSFQPWARRRDNGPVLHPENRFMSEERYMREALDLARANIQAGGRPFGAVLVYQGQVIARAVNEIHSTQDPTAHAELQAIRKAAQALGQARLDGAEIYASGHPCPMCLAAMHLCGIARAWFAYDNDESEPYGLSTAVVYAQMARAPQQQSLPLRPLKPAGEAGLYQQWKQANAQ
ncbi:guanine deaminase [Pseudomonas plecoglossicida]